MNLLKFIKKIPFLKNIGSKTYGIIRKKYMYTINKINGIDTESVVFMSFGGKSYSDNPKAISEKLHELYPKIKIIWLFTNSEHFKNIVPKYVISINTNSFTSLRVLATSKIWIDNFTKPLYMYKSDEQIYIQTWHGDRGFKKVLLDAWPEGIRPTPLIESEICSLAIAGSEYGEMQYKSAFNYSGDLLKKGTPRNDLLIQNSVDMIRYIKEKIEIVKEKKILLYAPTFRKKFSNNGVKQNLGEIDLVLILNLLEENTKDEWICLIRAHSAVCGLEGIPKDDRFIDISNYQDMSDLLLISDMLITDYSSSAGDFALRKKIILLYQNDRELYLEKERTFYFNMDKSPFRIAFNQTDINNFINNINDFDAEQNCKEILEFYGTYETGYSSEAVVEYMMHYLGDGKR